MTWTLAGFAIGTALTAAFAAGYLLGARHPKIDNDSYWSGFADGELHQQLTDRTPSLN